MHDFIKVEDWYKDGTALKRVLKKGKGAQPNADSIVKGKCLSDVHKKCLVFMKITVNDEVKVSNFP